MLCASAAVAVMAIAAMSARADLLPPGGGRPQPRQVVVNGTIATLTSTQITVNEAQGGQPRTIALAGPARIEDLGRDRSHR